MNLRFIHDYIQSTFPGVDVMRDGDDCYFFYDPNKNIPVNQRMPFATIMTNDKNDRASNLNRDGIYRLNLGVAKETYYAMFGKPPAFPKDNSPADTGFDYTTLDLIMPHPIYAAMSYVCVLNPNDATWEKVKPLLAEAYDVAEKRHSGNS